MAAVILVEPLVREREGDSKEGEGEDRDWLDFRPE